MSVKKAYQPIIEFLRVNEDKKVKTILPELMDMCAAKSVGSAATTVHRNEAGEVTHIRCGYFKQWLPLSHVEFGVKSGSASGYNPMCKAGMSLWTKAQRDAKKAKEEILPQVIDGTLSPDQVETKLAEIEEARLTVPAHPLGTDTIEEALALSIEDLYAILEAEAEEEPEIGAEETEAEEAQA